MLSLRQILVLMAGEETPAPSDEEVDEARRELDEALEGLRRARAAWSSAHTIDLDAVRQALHAAERQLDAARARLQRALERGDAEKE